MAERKRRVTKVQSDRGKDEGCWLYKEECFESNLEEYEGFIYKISCNHPDYKGYEYIGKKAFLHKSSKRVTKKEIKETGTRKRIIRSKINSGWASYWSSSRELLAVIKEIGHKYFQREILDFGISKSDLSLKEVEYMIKYNVLRKKESWNNWVSLRVYKKHLI